MARGRHNGRNRAGSTRNEPVRGARATRALWTRRRLLGWHGADARAGAQGGSGKTVTRWAACVEYDGSAYHGWQIQPGAPTIQKCVQDALSRVANAPVQTVCSGRTDAGVHATGQIVHFDTAAVRSPDAWLLGSNRYLPDDIAPQWFAPVDPGFHARFDAWRRDYRYWIRDAAAPSALWRRRAWHSHFRLDAEAMRHAAAVLVGAHDFSAFRAAQCQAKTPWREVFDIAIARRGDWLCVDVAANAFLHHMVRNMVGTLAEVGRGRRDIDWVGEVLAGRDRRRAGMTAPARGLYLRRVVYPDDAGLPPPHPYEDGALA